LNLLQINLSSSNIFKIPVMENLKVFFGLRGEGFQESPITFDEALGQETIAIRTHLKGKITYHELKKELEKTAPVTRINLRKLASGIR